MHHPTDRIAHASSFVTPIERERERENVGIHLLNHMCKWSLSLFTLHKGFISYQYHFSMYCISLQSNYIKHISYVWCCCFCSVVCLLLLFLKTTESDTELWTCRFWDERHLLSFKGVPSHNVYSVLALYSWTNTGNPNWIANGNYFKRGRGSLKVAKHKPHELMERVIKLPPLKWCS